jgi:Na+/H+-dicarboxylate symporter
MGVACGCILGIVLGTKATVLGDLSMLLIQALKTLATPLVFFAIVDAFCKTQFQAKSGFRLISISAINAFVASAIALAVSTFLPMGDQVRLTELAQSLEGVGSSGASTKVLPSVDLTKVVGGLVPHHIFEPFIENNVISIVILSILMGLAMRHLKAKKDFQSEALVLERFFSGGLQIVSWVLRQVIKAVPLMITGIIAKLVGTSGFGFFSTLGTFVLWITTGLVLHAGVYYSLILISIRKSPVQFFRDSAEALFTAFGTGSSLATLSVTLRVLQNKMKVTKESSQLAACVGTNLNHDGILLYEALTALFVAQVFGISLTFSQKAMLLLTSTLAAVGIAGVPDAGLITLSLVLGSVGLPLSFVPVLTTVDWLIGRMRATTNVTSDLVVANVLDYINLGRDSLVEEAKSNQL